VSGTPAGDAPALGISDGTHRKIVSPRGYCRSYSDRHRAKGVPVANPNLTATARIARFIRRLDVADVPPEVSEKARTCVLNGYGIALGCHDTPYAVVARSAALNMYGEHPAGATLLGDGRRTAIAGAVLANAALFHGRAQEEPAVRRISAQS
jgi:hypothetical protein